MNKKGFELSINFIVILIISLVIFASAIYFTGRFFSQSTKYRDTIDEQTEAQIRALLAEGARVAIPLNKIDIKRGAKDYFAIGVQNKLGRNADFIVTVSFNKAYESNEDTSAFCEGPGECPDVENWLLWKEKTLTIKNNEGDSAMAYVIVGSTIKQGEYTRKGIYVFNVEVETEINGVVQSYDGHVHKFYVEVP